MSDADKSTKSPVASVIHEGLPTQLPDIDPDETADWLESLDGLLDEKGIKAEGVEPEAALMKVVGDLGQDG